MLSHNQRKKDAIETIEARRIAADYLHEANLLVDKAIRKLSHNKSNDVIFDLKQVKSDIEEQISILRNKENDPV